MKMIIVTRKTDEVKVYLNPANVCAVYPQENTDRTIVLLANGGYVETKESADAVARLLVSTDEDYMMTNSQDFHTYRLGQPDRK